MYPIHTRDRVRELTDVPLPASDAPDPLVLADEETLVVSYDEAFATHLLADRGLPPYGAFEVESSSWLRGLEERNRGNPRHDPQLFQQLRHLVWTFHDSVLECAALGYSALEAQGGPEDLLARMHELLRSS